MPSPSPAELVPSYPQPEEQPRPSVKPKGRGKRTRTLGPPFHVILYGHNGRKMDVTLESAAEGEECPLTLGPIAEDTLDFLQPTTTWFANFPEVKKAVLPCGHSFGALNILYHFARRNMRCPCCRAGMDTRLTFRCIPPLFRNLMEAKIIRELREDTDELVENDHRVASNLQESSSSSLVYILDTRFVDLIMSGSLSLDICFSSYNEQRPPLATLSVPLLAHVNHDEMNYCVCTLPRGSISDFISYQLRDPSVCGVDFTVIVDTASSDGVRVASTNSPIRLDRQVNREVHVINAEGGSTFTVEFHEGHSRIFNFEWKVPTSYLNNLR